MKFHTFGLAIACSMIFSSDSQAQPYSGGFFVGTKGSNANDLSSVEIAIGENAGRFTFQNKQGRCEGYLVRGNEELKWVSTLETGDCDSVGFEVQDVGGLVDVSVSGDHVRIPVDRVLPLSPDTDVVVPQGIDVLGVELGMSKEEVERILVDERGFKKHVPRKLKDSRLVQARSAFNWYRTDGHIHKFPGFSIGFDHKLSIPKSKDTFAKIDGLQFMIDAEDPNKGAITVGFIDNEAYFVFRMLAVDKNSLEASAIALNEKYGSFSLASSWGEVEAFFDRPISDSRYIYALNFYRAGRSGASSYRSDGTKLDVSATKSEHRKNYVPSGCIMSSRLRDTAVKFPGVEDLETPSNCTTDAFWGIDERSSLAYIAVYQAYRIFNAQWEFGLRLNERQWVNNLKDAGAPVKTIVPEL